MPLIWQDVADSTVLPRLYLNGFPKTGLHLLELMVEPYLDPALGTNAWVSSHEGVWSDKWADSRGLGWNWSLVRQGTYIKGHCAYRKDYAEFLELSGMAHVFIYRDLRDVAVSSAYHVLDPRVNWIHPGKEMFKMMGDFREVLKAIIVGLGPFPGLGKRWEQYHPWLEQAQMLCVRYEDAIADPQAMAHSIVEYSIDRTAYMRGIKVKLSGPELEKLTVKMAAKSKETSSSPTFRKGGSGGWKELFSPEHVKLFKKHVGKWLIALGYEKDDNW